MPRTQRTTSSSNTIRQRGAGPRDRRAAGTSRHRPAHLCPTDDNAESAEGVAFLPQDMPATGMGWPIDADAFRRVLMRLEKDYPGTQLIITENGASFPDTVLTGKVNDGERIQYLADHLRAVHEALQAGVHLRGYIAWSLMDNFEWAYGYDKRFGLVHVDYATQQRLPKDSAHWFSRVIAGNGFSGDGRR